MQTHETTSPYRGPVFSALFDEDGFLLDRNLWSEQLGRTIADEEGLGPLTEMHWRVIHYIRGRFLELGGFPSMRRVCRATQIPKDQVNALFGGCRSIWRIAGLPNPGEEARTYLF